MKVLITDPIDPEGIRILEARGLEVDRSIGLAGDALGARLAEVDALIVRSETKVTAQCLASARVRAIGRAGVGVNNIDVDAASRKGIAVMNTPTGNIHSAFEHTMALLLSLARNVPRADQSIKAGRWERSKFMGVELGGKTLGIVGVGQIGSRVARAARAFGMEVVGFDPFLTEKRAEEIGVRLFRELDPMLQVVDFLTLHVPLTDETKNLIGAARLARMKPEARIVNCSRGGVIDERALLAAVVSGKIAGAALDVFEAEPVQGVSAELAKRSEIVATPHLGASTFEAQQKVGIEIAHRIADALLCGIYRGAVNMPVEDWSTYERVRPFLVLAERLGYFSARYVQRSITSVEVEFAGESFEEKPAMVSAVLTGILTALLGESVNFISAPVLAAERGLEVTERSTGAEGLYRSMLRIRLATGERQYTFAGAVFHERVPRIVEVDGYTLELTPEGCVLVFENHDRPGVIGAAGTILGRSGCNIAQFTLGRTGPGGDAMAALNLDSPASGEILRALEGVSGMKWVRQIVFDHSLVDLRSRTGAGPHMS